MPILDIAGAYCPHGCGQTLHRMSGGMIQCLAKECPDPGAAQKILASQQYDDLVDITESGWAILHPLRERNFPGGLYDCPVNKMLAEIKAPPVPSGRYRVTIIGNSLNFEAVTADGAAQDGPGESAY